MARPQNLEEEVNSPMNDDGDLPFSEPVAEKDDHSGDETQVEEPDHVTEASSTSSEIKATSSSC